MVIQQDPTVFCMDHTSDHSKMSPNFIVLHSLHVLNKRSCGKSRMVKQIVKHFSEVTEELKVELPVTEQ